MSTKAASVDDNVSEFYYSADLSIDPPLPDSKLSGLSGDHLKMKQVKDEDVIFDPTEGIKVVTRNVTTVEANHAEDDYTYNYDALKKSVKAIAKVAKDAGSVFSGQIVVRDANTNNRYFRIKVTDCVVTIERALLGWPDGTNSPFPGA